MNFFYSFYFLCFSMVFYANAEQLSFSKKERGDKIQFNYRWHDYKTKEKNLTFILAKHVLYNHFRTLKSFKKKYMNAYIYKTMQLYTQTHPLKGIQVNFVKDDNGAIKIAIKGQKREDITRANQQISKLRKQYSSQYLTQNYYQQLVTYDGIKTIKPNYVLIAQQSVSDLKIFKKLVLEEVTVKNIRKVTNFVLGFVQSIPLAEAGSEFKPPLKLLYRNKGDYNSKVTLTAAILRALMPRISMVIVHLDHHALFGIDVLAQKNEVTLLNKGITYVLAEPIGPKLYPLGEVAPFSKQAVLAGIYTIDKFKSLN